MNKPFNMELFLSGVLNGSKATRRRHLRQAQIMQAAIQQRWQRDNPWTWQLKHVRWFVDRYLENYAPATQYYYSLTVRLVFKRLNKVYLHSDQAFKRPNAKLRSTARPAIALAEAARTVSLNPGSGYTTAITGPLD